MEWLRIGNVFRTDSLFSRKPDCFAADLATTQKLLPMRKFQQIVLDILSYVSTIPDRMHENALAKF